MKKLLALVIVLVLLAAMVPAALAASDVVYVSVSVDGELLVAAQPVTVTDLTVQGVLKEAHKQFYSGGEGGYAAGIDAAYNMFLISKCWGIMATPYVMLNGTPLGADPSMPSTADVAPVKAGDNIVISTSSDSMNKPALAIGLTVELADGKATLTATNWVLDFMTFTYKPSPFAGAKVIDVANGAELGITDDNGQLSVPASGAAAIAGLAAIPVDGTASSTAGSQKPPEPTGGDQPAPAGGMTVYISVSVDGVLQVAAQPIVPDGGTVESAIIKAHELYYSGGRAGYAAGIDAQYGMFLINTCWGIATTPYVIYNGTPLGADTSVPSSADAAPLKEGDNIVITTASGGNTPTVGALTYDGKSLYATTWALDFTTFTYNKTPLGKTDIIDAETGKVLGQTDGTGKIEVKTPDCGVVAITGLAAVPIGEVKTFKAFDGKYVPPAHDYSLFGGPEGRLFLYCVIACILVSAILVPAMIISYRKEMKLGGVKYAGMGSVKLKTK